MVRDLGLFVAHAVEPNVFYQPSVTEKLCVIYTDLIASIYIPVCKGFEALDVLFMKNSHGGKRLVLNA